MWWWGAELLVVGTERDLADDLLEGQRRRDANPAEDRLGQPELAYELPAHRGDPEISVGNALGTVLFS